MRKVLLLAVLLLIGGATSAKNAFSHDLNFGYGNAIIFTETGVEFAIYPQGSFDFQIIGHHYRPHANYNSGYDYNRFAQYDDYGAVVQVLNVPIYYDYYGRIIRAGGVTIEYNAWGFVKRVGGLQLYYNSNNHFAYYDGHINAFNMNYIYRPWHQYYMVPRYVIVYTTPYRMHYNPMRYDYEYYRTNPHKRNNLKFYRPGDEVVAFNRGRRTESARNLKEIRNVRTSVTKNNVRTSVRNENNIAIRDNSARTDKTETTTRSTTREIKTTPQRKRTLTVPVRTVTSSARSSRTSSMENTGNSRSTVTTPLSRGGR
ncbi:MAG TPA: hypothetical protein VFM70_00805 [Salinimicrobium sp.]|nr:hypothetical protein [Salinimicrobium sp.]